MLISCAWLRELTGVEADPAEIARRLTARGLTVDAVTQTEGDAVLDIDVPANRPDALGHRGVAREVAAAFGAQGALPGSPARAGALTGFTVTIEAPELCRRYTAGIVRGVRVGPSPEWVVRRLAACGLRSINNVVDASNLVMLEIGQPVHFFDLATLAGPAIRVRRAAPGERMTTLDGVERMLDPDMVVIADAERGIGLGGVIGGSETEIKDATKDVLVEAAWFAPASVRRTSRALGVTTDASQRFERGCDPEAPPFAQQRAADLLRSLAGGRPEEAIEDLYPRPFAPRALTVRLARADRLLGFPVTAQEAEEALGAVGLAPRSVASGFEVGVPSWRVDLEREEDLVEEIGRHLGYDRIPARVPQTAPTSAGSAGSTIEERVRDRLAALGFSEAFNYAMVGPGEDDAFVAASAPEPLALTNPIAEPLSRLRRALLPGLARAAAQNVRRGVGDVRLFEVGRVFHPRATGTLPDEPLRAAFAWYGSARPRHWSEPARPADASDAAGLVEDLLALVAGPSRFRTHPADLPALHPGRSTAWLDGEGRPVGWSGPLHPDLAAGLDIDGALVVGEIDLGLAAGGPHRAPAYRPVPRVPAMARDLSIVVDPGVPAGSVLAALTALEAPAPASFTWIDRYDGPPLAAGQAAMTLRVILQPVDRTLTDADAEAFLKRLVAALDTVPGARLRKIDT